MSWWMRRQSKDGRSEIWAIDIDPPLLAMLLGIFTGMMYHIVLASPNVLWLGPGSLMVAGVCMLAVAKIPVYRKGIFTSWGTSGMTDRGARLYRRGYLLIFIGMAVAILLRMTA